MITVKRIKRTDHAWLRYSGACDAAMAHLTVCANCKAEYDHDGRSHDIFCKVGDELFQRMDNYALDTYANEI